MLSDAAQPDVAPPPVAFTPHSGLTTAEVAARLREGRTNAADEHTSRPLSAILKANLLTRFNAILGVLVVVVLVVGSPQDALFGLVLVWNALIGILQELRAKRTLDRLAVLSAPRATVVRDGATIEIAIGAVVEDDLVRIRTGDQVPADGIVSEADGLEVDESQLTGESDPVAKHPGDSVLSASVVVAGDGAFQATAVGAESYARRLATEARRFTQTRSELMVGINTLLRWITWGLVIVGPMMLVSGLAREDDTLGDTLVGVVAALVGMVPEGLVLLTSIAFGVAAVTLARRKVLVQELPAVEGLARVDVVCLDKTGTITEGIIRFDEVEPVGDVDDVDLRGVLGAIADDPDANGTIRALGAAFPPPDAFPGRVAEVPFSSERKWSAVRFEDGCTWVIGAPEMVLPAARADDPLMVRAAERAGEGERVLVLARTTAGLHTKTLPAGLAPVALVTFDEVVRDDAPQTMDYFRAQDVTLKVVSGDSARTVGAIAGRVGIGDGPAAAIDAHRLPAGDTGDVIVSHDVFGRVLPRQKREFVRALQAAGHTVAMTGDGVNDALALKDADIGVAMANGAPATRAVAQIVLLDSRFSHLPSVVAEGRRVIANIERVASLFLIKNVYAALLALTVAVAGVPYPFLPRHLTLISSLTIGIPAFVLSFAPTNQRYVPGFLGRVLRFAVPVGAITAVGIYSAYALARAENLTIDEARTAATIVTMIVGLVVLFLVARPLNPWKVALVSSMAGLFAMALVIPPVRDFFDLELPVTMLAQSFAIGASASAGTVLVWRMSRRWVEPERPV